MSQLARNVLLLDQSTDLIDTLFDLLNESSLPDLRVTTCFSLQDGLCMLQDRTFALIVMRLTASSVTECSELISLHHGMPLIGLVDEPDSVMMFSALRLGVSDLLPLNGVQKPEVGFIDAVERALQRADMAEQNRYYKDELEQSLAELQADQQAAYHVQRNMMPPERIELAGITARYILLPSLYLSGDFVDVVPIDDDRVVFYLADVSGHGASSALVTVLLKNMTQVLVREYRDLPQDQQPGLTDILLSINSQLLETGVGKHLSMFIGVVDQRARRLHYAVGGHHPMPLLTDAKGTRYLEGRGMPVGLFAQPVYDERSIELKPPFQVTLFSDGILEVLPQKEMVSREEFVRGVVDNLRGAPPEKLKNALLARYNGDVPDDIAIMTVVGQ
jgi:sigma-B regulation protein RsbU (phosphoserine phosphatase)